MRRPAERTLDPFDPFDPFDPAIGISWPTLEPVLSDRDRDAPTLAQLRERALLPGMNVVEAP